MYDTDVLIVGAGPTGLTLAASLVKQGYRDDVVDRQAAGRQHLARRASSMPAPSRCSKTSTWPGGWSRRASRRRGSPSATAQRTLIPIDFSALPTAYPYTLMVPQSTTERLLLDRLVELGGAVIRPKMLTTVDAGRRRRDGDVRRRRRHPGALRRRRRRHAQHRARAGRHRFPGRRVRPVVRPRRRPADRRSAHRRGHPVLGDRPG